MAFWLWIDQKEKCILHHVKTSPWLMNTWIKTSYRMNIEQCIKYWAKNKWWSKYICWIWRVSMVRYMWKIHTNTASDVQRNKIIWIKQIPHKPFPIVIHYKKHTNQFISTQFLSILCSIFLRCYFSIIHHIPRMIWFKEVGRSCGKQ